MKRKPGRTTITLFSLLSITCLSAQNLSHYGSPVHKTVYVTSLATKVQLEIRVPREMELSSGINYPIFFLFDRQNDINYNYNLHTIDYLYSFGNIPAPLLVGVSFPASVRNKWTTPIQEKGQSDSLLQFLLVKF